MTTIAGVSFMGGRQEPIDMNSRERVLAAINHQSVDRVPTDIWATGEVWEKLGAIYGSGEAAVAALHIDGFGGSGPLPYQGPALPA